MAAASGSRPRCRGRSGLRRATVLANGQSGRLEGKCHREQTADGLDFRAQARVKRCGKSAPGAGVTRLARQTPPGARPSRGHGGPPPRQGQSPGRPLRWMATYGPLGPGQNPAYRPTHRPTSLMPPEISAAAADPGPFEIGRAGPGYKTGAGDPDQPTRNVETPTPPRPVRSDPARSARPRA